MDEIFNPKPDGVVDAALDKVEGVYDALGLMRGTAAEARRFVFGNIIGAGLVYIIKPTSAFTSDGRARPWALLQPDSPEKTAFPWWMPGLLLGAFSGFLI